MSGVITTSWYDRNREAVLTRLRERRRVLKEDPPIDPWLALVMEQIIFVDDCWVWTGATTPDGYGTFSINGCAFSTHWLIYRWLVGPIPPKHELDHGCRIRNCGNPRHLEPVTHGENVRRGWAFRLSSIASKRAEDDSIVATAEELA